jgi:hypothetical protein
MEKPRLIRKLGEIGPRKARPDNRSRRDQPSMRSGIYTYMARDNYFRARSGFRARLFGRKPGHWNFFLNVPSER